MASISGAAAPPSSCRLRLQRQLLMRPSHLRLRAPHSIADLPRSSSSSSRPSSSHAPLASRQPAVPVEKDPIKLWDRYVEWLYQHKELGLFVDVSRMGFTDEFLRRMEPLLQKAFVDMAELEKGAIANPDEGRMVGHYWLRDPGLAPNSFLRTKIEKTVDHILAFSHDIVSGKIKPPSSQAGRFTQILSIGIGGSSLGPQFVSEALAPDNPPLKWPVSTLGVGGLNIQHPPVTFRRGPRRNRHRSRRKFEGTARRPRGPYASPSGLREQRQRRPRRAAAAARRRRAAAAASRSSGRGRAPRSTRRGGLRAPSAGGLRAPGAACRPPLWEASCAGRRFRRGRLPSPGAASVARSGGWRRP